MADNSAETEEIRDLRETDHADIAALAGMSFAFTQSRFVAPGKEGGKVITVDGAVVAASLLRIVPLPSGRKIGFIAWLMTHPDYRGRNMAMKLVQASTSYLQSLQCDAVVTDIEGYNTASANVFYRAGYRRLSAWQQFRRWNPVDSIYLWIRTGFALDPGYFFWVADTSTEKASSWRARFSAVLFNALLAVLAFSSGGGIFLTGSPSVPPVVLTTISFFIGVGALLAAREFGTRVVAWVYDQPLEYRAWSGGWGISLLIAIVFGRTFPLPGNLYPPGDGWSYRHVQVVLGKGAIVSTLLVAGLILLGLLAREATDNQFLNHVAFSLLFVGKPLLLFDTLFAIAPFEGFNGRHLKVYNRLIWLLLSALAVLLFFLT